MSVWAKFGLDEEAISEAKQEMEYKPLPEGEYPVVVANTVLKESKNGKPMLEIEYTVLDKGRTLYQRKILDNKVSQKIIFQTFLALGFTEEQFRKLDSFDSAVGKKALAVVKIETSQYNGETRHHNGIKRLKPLTSANATSATSAKAPSGSASKVKEIADPATATTTEDAPF